jgi:hypothetical protein
MILVYRVSIEVIIGGDYIARLLVGVFAMSGQPTSHR